MTTPATIAEIAAALATTPRSLTCATTCPRRGLLGVLFGVLAWQLAGSRLNHLRRRYLLSGRMR